MDAVIWYSLAIGGPLATSIIVNIALLAFHIVKYIAARDLPHYLSLRQICQTIRPFKNITWLHLIVAIAFISTNILTISYGVKDAAGFIRRSGVLSVINMAPLFLGTQMNLIASRCGLSLQSFVAVHRWLGIMAILQGLSHAVVALTTQTPDHLGKLSDKSGVVVTAILVAIPLTSVLRRRAYEVFAAVHFCLALCAAVFIYLHNPSSGVLESPKRYLIAAAGCLGLAWIIRLGLVLYRNTRLGSLSSRAAVRTITFELEQSSIPLEDAVHVHVRLSRPWNVRAGQYVYLTIPGASHTACFQSHPFYIAWWYRVDDDNYIVLIAQKQKGFTERVFRIRDSRHSSSYGGRALIDGPYGKEMGLEFYDNVLLFATGIGIAGQLSHVAQLLRGYYDCGVQTKRVTLFWQVDAEIQLGWVADRMQQLLELDEKSQVLHIYLFVVGGFLSRDAGMTDFVNRGKRIVVTYRAMDAGYLTGAELERHGGRSVISLCADPQTVNRVRILVQHRADSKVHVKYLDFSPDAARPTGSLPA
ncbi:ferric reductase transmembrane component 3 [Verticillium dahliae VdLs.17]|uniref:ferric-chelate reductase (NADPH) n=1 Tax=Verticillium dahliae (strain VdLs.17 / ATCC MYA-4575 / FGSC 10137) TaxID=498257 RepID=G2WXM8_VERDV|nr:ferric reductase transmembrane component 3 [Verticillium dahliae VdLs.17]EGY20836.1 ferric reductase transmembrane component 3 [Verticillium dahliae VdLs.17]